MTAWQDSILALAIKAKQNKSILENEEQTKTALILPMLELLGIDTSNPKELIPEYSADFGVKRGEKVDYCLMQGTQPLMLIEAKAVNVGLGVQQVSQLFRYFSVSTARIGLLTDGIEYKFFTDTRVQNVMDDTPFFEFSLLSITDEQIDCLSEFKHSCICDNTPERVIGRKEFKDAFIRYLNENTQGVSPELVSFMIAELGTCGIARQSAEDVIRTSLAEILSHSSNGFREVTEGTSLELSDIRVGNTIRCERVKSKSKAKGYTGVVSLLKSSNVITGSALRKVTLGTKEINCSTVKDLACIIIDLVVDNKISLPDSVTSGNGIAGAFLSTAPQDARSLGEYRGYFFEDNVSSQTRVRNVLQWCKGLGIRPDKIMLHLEAK